MKSLVLERFHANSLKGIALREQSVPQPQPHQVLVRMRAASLNPADVHIAKGEMKWMSPVRPPIALGVDGAGVIEQLGEAVQGWSVGDEVFFYTGLVHCGTLAEYARDDARALARKPAAWSFEQAASSALALLCAHLSLVRADLKISDRILVHGGGGAVGSAAVMLAHAMGMQVDTTASISDTALLRKLGASRVFDYRTEPLRNLPPNAYDMVLDAQGGEMFLGSLALVRPGGVVVSLKVMTGLEDMLHMGMRPPLIFKWLLPLMFRRYTQAARRAGVRVAGVATCPDGDTLTDLGERASTLGYSPRMAGSFALSDAKSALEYLASGQARGKVLVSM
jgi:NADPH:quinone reductase-like Zn-dependent oxidoreductase